MPNGSQTIVLVSNSAWNIWHYRRPLYRALLQSGFRVEAWVPDGPEVAALQKEGVQIVCLRHLQAGSKSSFNSIRLLWEFQTLLRKRKPAAVLSFTVKPNLFIGLLSRFIRIPCFLPTVTGLGYLFVHNSWPHRLIRQLYRPAFRRARRVFFHNEEDRQLFVGNAWVTDRQAKRIPGSGIDVRAIPVLPFPEQSHPRQLLYIGRMLVDKGLSELVEALRILQSAGIPFQCTLLGPIVANNPVAIPRTKIEAWEAEGLLRYSPPTADVIPHIQSCHLVVLPSYREGLPRAILEAMAAGRPVVATAVPGCKELVVPGKTGRLVPVKNAAALATALAELMGRSDQELERMGQFAREIVEAHYDDQFVVKAYLGILNRVIHPQSSRLARTD